MRICYRCGTQVMSAAWPVVVDDFDIIYEIMRVTIKCPQCSTRYQVEIYAGNFKQLEDDDEDSDRIR